MFLVAFQMFVRVLDHHDRRVHHRADGNRYAAQRHDVGVDALLMHDDERGKDAQRQSDDGHKGRAQVEQEHQTHQRDHHEFFHQLELEVVHRAMDQRGAVVGFDNLHAFGQTLAQLFKLGFDPLDGGQRVLAVTHHHDAAGNLALTVQIGDHATHLRADLNGRDIAQQHRGALLRDIDRDGLQVIDAAQITARADHVLGLGKFQHRATDLAVGCLDRVADFHQRDAVGTQFLRIDYDLVLAHHAADRGDLGHAGHGLQLVL